MASLLLITKNETQEKYGVINVETGKYVLETKYDSISYLPYLKQFLVSSNGKYGIMDQNGKIKLKVAYDDIQVCDNENELYVVKENDLIVNITFAWESAIAIVKKEDEGGLVSHRFPTYTFDEKISNSKYFQYVIIQKRFRIMLDLISPGGAGRNRVMSKKDFLTLKWELPCIEEQNKIANFLSSIDTKIQQTQKQLESSKEFKKALFQQMFV